MTFFVSSVHVLVCLLLIVLVLLQKGKGAEIGAVFGGSSAATLFGSRGAGTFLTRITTWSAVVFMATSFYLAYVALNADAGGKFSAPPADLALPSSAPGDSSSPASDIAEVKDAAPAEQSAAPAPTPDQSAQPSAPSDATP